MTLSIEQDVLANLSSELRSEGYEVFIQPRRQLLPSFFGSYVPDLVARREGDNIAIEVIDPERSGDGRLAQLSAIFADHPDWTLKIVGTARSRGEARLRPLSDEQIADRITETNLLVQEGRFDPAIVYGWSALEAIGRRLLPDRFAKAQTPMRLAGVLAEVGWITPTQADRLRRIAEFRNAIVHGTTAGSATAQDATDLLTILRDLQLELTSAP